MEKVVARTGYVSRDEDLEDTFWECLLAVSESTDFMERALWLTKKEAPAHMPLKQVRVTVTMRVEEL